MFRFLFRLIRFGLSLVIAVLFTLAVLALQVRYEGDGRFQVRLKERLTLEDTLTFGDAPTRGPPAAGPAGSHLPAALPRRRSFRTASSGSRLSAGVPSRRVDRSPPPRRSLRASADAGAARCRATRERLAESVERFEDRTGRAMDRLDIFDLLDAEVLDELPACPSGGVYQLSARATEKVACSLH